MRQFRNMLYVTVSALFMATAVTPWEASASSLTIPTTNNKSAEYQIAAIQFLPEAEDSEFGFGGKKTSGNYNRGETQTKGCTEGTTSKCTSEQSLTRSYRAQNGQLCYVCGINNAQKCLDKGFRKQENWPKNNIVSSNERQKPESFFASIFNSLLGVKNANAARIDSNVMITPTEDGGDGLRVEKPMKDPELWDGENPLIPEPIGPIYPGDPVIPSDPITSEDAKTFFEVTATCPEDSTYVKGSWKILETTVCTVNNCESCLKANTSTCGICKAGYELSSGKCFLKLVANCSMYDKLRNCITCATDYKLSSGNCILDIRVTCENMICNGRRYCCPRGLTCADATGSGEMLARCYMEVDDKIL